MPLFLIKRESPGSLSLHLSTHNSLHCSLLAMKPPDYWVPACVVNWGSVHRCRHHGNGTWWSCFSLCLAMVLLGCFLCSNKNSGRKDSGTQLAHLVHLVKFCFRSQGKKGNGQNCKRAQNQAYEIDFSLCGTKAAEHRLMQGTNVLSCNIPLIKTVNAAFNFRHRCNCLRKRYARRSKTLGQGNSFFGWLS